MRASLAMPQRAFPQLASKSILRYAARMFESLPSAEEREAILDGIRGLVEARGHESFVAEHVLLPSDR